MERGNSEQEGVFPPTDWSRLEAVRCGNSTERNEAITFFAERYDHSVLMFIRQLGHGSEAEDLKQEFWKTIIQKKLLHKADQERGPFRNFLLKSLKHFLINQHRANQAQKRRPPNGLVSLGEVATDVAELLLPANHLSPDLVFELDWRCELIRYVLSCVEAECASKLDNFIIFREYVVLPNLENTPQPSQAELAKRYGLTESKVATHIEKVRQIFKEQLRKAIGKHARSEQEFKELVRDLKLQCYIADD